MSRGLLAASSAGVALAAPAYAQDEVGPSVEMSEIIVTARRMEENLQDVPISITVYDQEAITKRNIVNPGDIAVYTPSLAVNTRYGPEKASFAIRGFVQDFQTAPSVGTYFADVVGPRASSTTTAGNGLSAGNLFDLQNVQVLKGPQGTLFGRNTTGGAVLLVPNKPTGDLEGYVEGSLGNYDMRRVQAVLNVPLAETFKIRLGVDRMKRDGYLRNRSDIGPRRLGNVDFIAARLSIVAELTPDLENYTIASYSDSDTYGVIPRVTECIDFADVAPGTLQDFGAAFGCAQVARQEARGDGWWDVENKLPNPRARQEVWQIINTTTWQATDNLTVKNIVSYAEHREDASLDLTGELWLNPDGSLFPPNFLIQNTDGYHYGAQSTFTEELQFQGVNGDLTWQAGFYLENSDPIGYGSQTVPFLIDCPDAGNLECNRGFGFDIPLPDGSTTFFPLGNLGRPFYQIWWRSRGLYAQGTYALTDQLSVTGGVRYTWDEHRHYQAGIAINYFEPNVPVAFCNNTIRNPGPGGLGTTLFLDDPNDFRKCDLEFEKKSDKPTWVVDLEYKPTPDILLYGKWSRGYRAGGVNTPFVFFETWEPEKVEAYEVGAKATLGGPIRGYVNVAAFYNDFSDQQIQVNLRGKIGAPVSSGTGTINAGKSRIWGVELDAAITPFEGLDVQAGYTYLNTKLQELVGLPAPDEVPWIPGESPWAEVVPTALEGNPLALSPKHSLQVTGTYTLPLDASIGEISFGATYVYTSSQIANTTTPFGKLPSSELLNLNASWRDVLGQPIDLSFFMTNATKNEFPVNVGGVWSIFGYEGFLTNEPRMWGVRLKYRFGR